MPEPWMEEERRQKKWDEWLQSRPVCDHCGYPIKSERVLVIDEKMYCAGCIVDNTYLVEELER